MVSFPKISTTFTASLRRPGWHSWNGADLIFRPAVVPLSLVGDAEEDQKAKKADRREELASTSPHSFPEHVPGFLQLLQLCVLSSASLRLCASYPLLLP